MEDRIPSLRARFVRSCSMAQNTREDSKNVKKHGKNGTLKTRCAPQCVELTNEPETLAKFTAELRARGFTPKQIRAISEAAAGVGVVDFTVSDS